ncbi:hypothetical protein BT69DRAFT_162248 [Atractiella rhizophila]|nr:hypothetical protein BT69DRAFT_162248 [Atractiella rhizophila]
MDDRVLLALSTFYVNRGNRRTSHGTDDTELDYGHSKKKWSEESVLTTMDLPLLPSSRRDRGWQDGSSATAPLFAPTPTGSRSRSSSMNASNSQQPQAPRPRALCYAQRYLAHQQAQQQQQQQQQQQHPLPQEALRSLPDLLTLVPDQPNHCAENVEVVQVRQCTNALQSSVLSPKMKQRKSSILGKDDQGTDSDSIALAHLITPVELTHGTPIHLSILPSFLSRLPPSIHTLQVTFDLALEFWSSALSKLFCFSLEGLENAVGCDNTMNLSIALEEKSITVTFGDHKHDASVDLDDLDVKPPFTCMFHLPDNRSEAIFDLVALYMSVLFPLANGKDQPFHPPIGGPPSNSHCAQIKLQGSVHTLSPSFLLRSSHSSSTSCHSVSTAISSSPTACKASKIMKISFPSAGFLPSVGPGRLSQSHICRITCLWRRNMLF